MRDPSILPQLARNGTHRSVLHHHLTYPRLTARTQLEMKCIFIRMAMPTYIVASSVSLSAGHRSARETGSRRMAVTRQGGPRPSGALANSLRDRCATELPPQYARDVMLLAASVTIVYAIAQ